MGEPDVAIPVQSVAFALSEPVKRTLGCLDGELPRARIMSALGLKDRSTFSTLYLSPALKFGLVEMTQPGSPRSPTQRYRLTEKGRNFRTVLFSVHCPRNPS